MFSWDKTLYIPGQVPDACRYLPTETPPESHQLVNIALPVPANPLAIAVGKPQQQVKNSIELSTPTQSAATTSFGVCNQAQQQALGVTNIGRQRHKVQDSSGSKEHVPQQPSMQPGVARDAIVATVVKGKSN